MPPSTLPRVDLGRVDKRYLEELDPHSPISPEEIIYRRVPKQRGMSVDLKTVQPDAFAPRMPNKKKPNDIGDLDGLSVYRAAFHTPEVIARVLRTSGSEPAWVAEFKAGDLIALGITLKPDPLQADKHPSGIPQPGHALIPEIHSGGAQSTRVLELKRELAALANKAKIHGPYDPPDPTSLGTVLG